MGEVLTRFCPRCRGENPYRRTHCVACGASLTSADDQSYADKLVWALGHPVREVRATAVYLLGMRRDAEAIPHLCRAFEQSPDDLFLQRDILQALLAIGGPRALSFLREQLAHPALVVWQQAERSVQLLAAGEGAADATATSGPPSALVHP
ncbi:MAG: HEAT repeat domain-containing protein [Syntrophomonadaceae bacterium]|jgi:HEAT repeat protein|nr:HEAT repeat domain-containing protein [Syntrophomonadaceae bacterium]MDH7497221.1 HEAT repeat domain-containing protein [Syntrophomonadaceae bacterium]